MKERTKQKLRKVTGIHANARPAETVSQWHFQSLKDELIAIGLFAKEVPTVIILCSVAQATKMTADGNCFFRAVADQLDGDRGDHVRVRHQVVQYLRDHEDHFAPFVEDDEGFGNYVARMSRDGTWAGHMEVQAASLCFKRNIEIFQAGQPIWRITNFSDSQAQGGPLHLSYHHGEHYNSVRVKRDSGSGQPLPINLQTGAATAGNSCLQEAWFSEKDAKYVAETTLCFDMARVKRALEGARGDRDVAVELLIEDLGNEDDELAIEGDGPGRTDRMGHCDAQDSVHVLATGDARSSGGLASGEGREDPVLSSHERGRSQNLAVDGRDLGTSALADASAAAAARSGTRTADNGSQRSAGPDDCHAAPGVVGRVKGAVSGFADGVKDLGLVALRLPGEVLSEGRPASAAGGVLPESDVPKREDASDRRSAHEREPHARRPQRNKPCPCGSARKYKHCCKITDDARTRRGDVTASDHVALANNAPIPAIIHV